MCCTYEIKIYPEWNVNISWFGGADLSKMIKIYPEWNVNASAEEIAGVAEAIKIYPEWNVNKYTKFGKHRFW